MAAARAEAVRRSGPAARAARVGPAVAGRRDRPVRHRAPAPAGSRGRGPAAGMRTAVAAAPAPARPRRRHVVEDAATAAARQAAEARAALAAGEAATRAAMRASPTQTVRRAAQGAADDRGRPLRQPIGARSAPAAAGMTREHHGQRRGPAAGARPRGDPRDRAVRVAPPRRAGSGRAATAADDVADRPATSWPIGTAR